MKNLGITRKIDNLGRFVIPKEYRDFLEINEGDSISICLENKTLTVNKIEDSCLFCNSKKNLTAFENKMICNSCCNKFLSTIIIK